MRRSTCFSRFDGSSRNQRRAIRFGAECAGSSREATYGSGRGSSDFSDRDCAIGARTAESTCSWRRDRVQLEQSCRRCRRPARIIAFCELEKLQRQNRSQSICRHALQDTDKNSTIIQTRRRQVIAAVRCWQQNPNEFRSKITRSQCGCNIMQSE